MAVDGTMPWQVPRQEHRVFARNPLIAVLVEHRFHPVLKVPSLIPDFQERVRGVFPRYATAKRKVVTFAPNGQVESREEQVFSFVKVDESATLTLSQSALTLDLADTRAEISSSPM